MLVNRNTSEAYWNSYRLLEKQLIRISHSIYFDDEQIYAFTTCAIPSLQWHLKTE